MSGITYGYECLHGLWVAIVLDISKTSLAVPLRGWCPKDWMQPSWAQNTYCHCLCIIAVDIALVTALLLTLHRHTSTLCSVCTLPRNQVLGAAEPPREGCCFCRCWLHMLILVSRSTGTIQLDGPVFRCQLCLPLHLQPLWASASSSGNPLSRGLERADAV